MCSGLLLASSLTIPTRECAMWTPHGDSFHAPNQPTSKTLAWSQSFIPPQGSSCLVGPLTHETQGFVAADYPWNAGYDAAVSVIVLDF
jgi:hypothetical protein